MSGHILNDKEINDLDRYLDANEKECPITEWSVSDARDLIATIRDRDRTIARWENISRQQSEQNYRLMDTLQKMRERSEEIKS